MKTNQNKSFLPLRLMPYVYHKPPISTDMSVGFLSQHAPMCSFVQDTPKLTSSEQLYKSVVLSSESVTPKILYVRNLAFTSDTKSCTFWAVKLVLLLRFEPSIHTSQIWSGMLSQQLNLCLSRRLWDSCSWKLYLSESDSSPLECYDGWLLTLDCLTLEIKALWSFKMLELRVHVHPMTQYHNQKQLSLQYASA
jgi:hypothetical protein